MAKVSDDTKCKQCGLTFERVHLTYDGWRLPLITVPCVKRREKCHEDCDCMGCVLEGGFIKELYGTGRHKWK